MANKNKKIEKLKAALAEAEKQRLNALSSKVHNAAEINLGRTQAGINELRMMIQDLESRR